MRRFSAIPFVLAALATACGGSDSTGSTGGTTADTVVNHISVTGSSTVLTPGQQVTLTATALNAADSSLSRAFVWSSSASPIASVSTSGVVTAVTAGTATIMATTGTKFGTIVITVSTASGGSDTFADITAGYDYNTCGRALNGPSLCWGHNIAGQLGDSTTFNRLVPTAVAGGHTFTQLATSAMRTCGLLNTGAAYCWGQGPLGDGTTNTTSAPVAVSGGLSFVQIVVGSVVICGRTGAGAAYCWGALTDGGIGDGTGLDRLTPTAVTGGLSFTELSAAGLSVCGRTSAGAVYCWGRNVSGQLGDGTNTQRNAPVAVAGGLTFAHVYTGYDHTCAITGAGAAYCWGTDTDGELGDGTTVLSRNTPTLVSTGLVFTQLALGTFHTCGLSTSATAYCWGANSFGQLGDGGTTPHVTPTATASGRTFVKIVAGHVHTCGLNSLGVAFCWGDNVYGELGDGTMFNRPAGAVVQ
ncbi:MAG TPA: Ig-like domain-containing protein [Gemmatimonadales bacterium]|jgi:alpha-tubulin suppressor-like RCC1 family protein|nr:Ig-like domain-containing protein [Gemmatimonadales bacterium]